MPKSNNPVREKAKRLYANENRTLKEIADALHVPEGTVRSWKNRDKWDSPQPDRSVKKNQRNVADEKTVATDRKDATLHKKKRGRPTKAEAEAKAKEVAKPKPRGRPHKGNTFAVGHKPSSPKGNKNALKHGAYSIASWGVLDDEEEDFLKEIPDETEAQLMQEIQMYTIRERRIMKAINKYRNQKDSNGKPVPLYVESTMQSETKRKFDSEDDKEEYRRIVREKIDKGDRMPGDPYQTTTTTGNVDDLILRLEKELSTVQKNKNSAIDSLAEYRRKREEAEGGKGNDLVHAWIDAVREKRKEESDD